MSFGWIRLPFDLWNTRGPRNFNHLLILIFFSGGTLLLRRECLGMDFTDGLRGLPHLPLGSYHDERGLHGARQKDEGDKCSRCPSVSLVCLGPYVHSPLRTLLSLSVSPSVCFCPLWIRYSAFSLVCWMSVE